MNKRLAFDNRLCYERSVARQHAIHQQKMQAMVPTALSPSKLYLDSNEPTKQPHLCTNAKRKQLDKERQMAISMQNQRLASKMDHILHRHTNHGLPLIQHGANDRRNHLQNTQDTHSSNRARPSRHHPLPPSSKRGIAAVHQRERYDCEEDSSDDGFQVMELPPCVLLEATTRKGVQIQVEELQIELTKPDRSLSNDSDAGDRGLVIRGKWLESIEGEHNVSVEALERIAQEIDDLEIRIKLETVHRIPRVGNFPRLSVLLTEEELGKLLSCLVQRLNIEVLEDREELVISTRPYRGSDAAATRGSLEPESKQRRRPRTCPSTMPGANTHSQMDFMRPSEVDDVAVASVATSQADTLMRLQLGSWLNIGKMRFGIRLNDALYLVRISFSADASTLTMNAVALGPPPICIKRQVAYSSSQVRILVQQLESQQTTRDELVIQEIHTRLLLRV